MSNFRSGATPSDPAFDRIVMNGRFHAFTLSGITATAAGTQATGVPLSGDLNVITTVATINDSVTLPNSVAGHEITIINAGAASMNVFPAVGESINALAANTAYALAAGKGVTLFGVGGGKFYGLQGA